MNHGYICFKFDDGYKTDLTVAMQTQLDYGLAPRGTSNICGQYVLNGHEGRLNVDDCKTLVSNGWELADHTFNNIMEGVLLTMTDDEIRQELIDTNDFFANSLQMPKPRAFQTPGGKIDQRVLTIISYEREIIGFGQPNVLVTPFTNKLNLPSTSFGYEQTEGDTDSIYRLIDDAVRNGYGIIFGFHELTAGGSALSAYINILEYGLKVGAKFVTESELVDTFNLKGFPRVNRRKN